MNIDTSEGIESSANTYFISVAACKIQLPMFRYVKYYYFRHNDKKIPDHIVDRYVKKRLAKL